MKHLPASAWGIASAVLLLIGAAFAVWHWMPVISPSYHDRFAQGSADEWTAYGGAWRIDQGTLRNDSDERGAKILTGSYRWRNYRMQADVKLLGEGGDAGVIVRSNDEQPGVDAYNGYYIGVRMYDSSLVIGRSDHGWLEARPVPLPGLHSHAWYHLDVAIVGCSIAAAAGPVNQLPVARIRFEERDCVPAGRIGLRSLATGAAWRNVVVRPARHADLVALAGTALPVLHPDYPRTEAAFNAAHNFPTFDDPDLRRRFFNNSGPRTEIQSIAQVYISARRGQLHPVTVRGTVSLMSPSLFVQDDTGGIAVPDPVAPPLNLGDEVEITGTPVPSGDLIGATASLPHAHVRLLWDHTPAAPLSVTAAQAASGDYDARLVELSGTLAGVHMDNERGMAVLDLVNGAQAFRAYLPTGQSTVDAHSLAPRSFLNLRGVCTLDPRYTQGVSAFALLLRSNEDIDRLAGPPWWTPRRLAEIGAAVLLLCLVVQYLFSRAKQWRWRAITQERERLAHELHDTLAQSFAGVAFQLQGIRNGLSRADAAGIERVNQQLDVACEVVRQTHEEASLSIAMLREEWPAGREIGEALEQCAAGIVAGGSIRIVRLDREPASTPAYIPVRIADALFHIGREAVVNAVRHAAPSQIALSVRYEAHRVILVVEDDGCGFDRSAQSRGFGLRGMQKRAQSIGAELLITGRAPSGTRVQVIAPLKDHLSSHDMWRELWARARRRMNRYADPAAVDTAQGSGYRKRTEKTHTA